LFGNIGFPEMMVIAVVALLVIGPQRLPELARSLGRTLRELKRATSDLQSSINLEEEYETEPRKTDVPGQGPAEEAKAPEAAPSGEAPPEASPVPPEAEPPREGGSRST
jgi:Tat protein translocase TatB subunit